MSSAAVVISILRIKKILIDAVNFIWTHTFLEILQKINMYVVPVLRESTAKKHDFFFLSFLSVLSILTVH